MKSNERDMKDLKECFENFWTPKIDMDPMKQISVITVRIVELKLLRVTAEQC